MNPFAYSSGAFTPLASKVEEKGVEPLPSRLQRDAQTPTPFLQDIPGFLASGMSLAYLQISCNLLYRST